MHSISDIQAEKVRRDFGLFVRESWHTLEKRPLAWNWHHEIIALELQECSRLARSGVRRDLLVNVPPGSLKSMQTSVMWWDWEILTDPNLSMLTLSNDDSLAKRDSRKARILLESEWYQSVYLAIHGRPFAFSSDQNEVHHFALDQPFIGFRMCAPYLGKITGKRTDRQVLDDPQDVKDSLGSSPQVSRKMEKAKEIDDQVLPSRLNDEDTCPRVLISQRIHPDDLSGNWIKEGVRHVVIRQEFIPDDPLNHPDDPRTEPGELLHPARTPASRVVYIKRKLGSKAYNAQHQQNPTNPAGGIFQRAKWTKLPRSQFPTDFDKVIQSWDLTFKGSERSDYVVGYVIGKKGGKFYVRHRFKDRVPYTGQKHAIESVSEMFPEALLKCIEDKANAEAIKDDLKNSLPGIVLVPARDDKVARAQAWSPTQEAGDIVFPSDHGDKEWVDDAIQVHADFPDGSYDDDVDALGHGILKLLSEKDSLEDVVIRDDDLLQINEWDVDTYSY